MKILFLVNELTIVNGITKHLYYLISGLLTHKNYQCLLICGEADNDVISKFQYLGVKVVAEKSILNAKRSYIRYLFSGIKIYNYILKNKIDIIHSHNHYAASIAEKIGIFLRIKTVQTNHGIIPEIGKLNHFSSKNIIAVNEHAFYYIKSHTKGKNVFLINNGIERENYFIKKSTVKINVVVASRLIYKKGIDLYIKAVAMLPKEIKEKAKFYIAGTGINEKGFIKLSDRLNVNIIFLGTIEKIQKLFCQTHIFINPTRSLSEGFPTVIIEAGLQKNLIISSNFRGSKKILKNDINSLIFKTGNEISLMNTIIDAINHFSEYTTVIENFYLLCTNYYGVNEMIEKITTIYEMK